MVLVNNLSKKLARASLNEKSSEKLYLVLDLDHTLIHAINVSKLSEKEKYLIEEADSREDLWRFRKGKPNEYLIKLRPFVREFLEEANKLFSLSVYTMATSRYARFVLQHIDPEKVYFGDRVIVREDSPDKKTLKLVEGDIRRIVIVDDKSEVWPDHSHNLLQIIKYIYFRAHNNSRSLSHAEQKTDESQSDGSLANVLMFLKYVHKRFQEELDLTDLRPLLIDPILQQKKNEASVEETDNSPSFSKTFTN